MVAQSAYGETGLRGEHHLHPSGIGLARAQGAGGPLRSSATLPWDETDEACGEGASGAEPPLSEAALLKRHTSVGHWLHTPHCARDLNLNDLLNLPDSESNRLIAALARVIQATQDAVRPFRFSVSPMDRGVHIEGDTVAVMIAVQVLERASHCTEGHTASAGVPDGIVADVIDNMLRCELSLVLNGLPKYMNLRSVSQAAYLQALIDPRNQLVLGLGPTGTGKTYLAIVAALNQLADERVQRIVLTRPHVVEEGEIVTAATRQERGADGQLEFFDDILLELLGHDRVARLKQDLRLEIIPLGRLRGRTLNNTFVILDEAQNTSISKMRMAVTRIGKGTRMVLNGDPSHVELMGGEQSGLLDLLGLIKGTDIAKIHYFEKQDIVRNDIVARIDRLYASRPGGSF